jgi:Cu/Ag efflux protein CusF
MPVAPRFFAIAFLLAAMLAVPASAQQAPGAVYTRAEVRSIFQQDQRTYIRLKLMLPPADLPFTTVTYRVPDPAALAGLRKGASVAFIAQRSGGENAITTIRPAPPCDRLRQCPPL